MDFYWNYFNSFARSSSKEFLFQEFLQELLIEFLREFFQVFKFLQGKSKVFHKFRWELKQTGLFHAFPSKVSQSLLKDSLDNFLKNSCKCSSKISQKFFFFVPLRISQNVLVAHWNSFRNCFIRYSVNFFRSSLRISLQIFRYLDLSQVFLQGRTRQMFYFSGVPRGIILKPFFYKK